MSSEYQLLREEAKRLGLSAKGSTEVLRKRIAEYKESEKKVTSPPNVTILPEMGALLESGHIDKLFLFWVLHCSHYQELTYYRSLKNALSVIISGLEEEQRAAVVANFNDSIKSGITYYEYHNGREREYTVFPGYVQD